MIPEDDLEGTFEELRELLVEAGFSWVVENAHVAMQSGISEKHTLERVLESPLNDISKQPRKRRETVIGMRPYNAREKLKLLVDEIERCIVLPLQIAGDLPKSLSATSSPLDAIEIGDDEPGKPVFRVALGKPAVGELVAALANATRELQKGL